MIRGQRSQEEERGGDEEEMVREGVMGLFDGEKIKPKMFELFDFVSIDMISRNHNALSCYHELYSK